MLITTVTQENRSMFEAMVPEECFNPLDLPGRFVIGAIGEDEEGQYAAGVLVFEVGELMLEDGSVLITADLRWIYVDPQARGRGAGDALMEEYFRIIRESGVVYLETCDLPLGEEYDELCAFLEDWGFTFTVSDVYQAVIPLGKLLSAPFFGGGVSLPVEPLSESPAELLFRELERYEDLPMARSDLSELLPFCDLDVSCAFWDRQKLRGLLLVLSSPNGNLEPVLMRATVSDPRVVISLARFAGARAGEKYPPDQPVKIDCRMQAASSLVDLFLPDLQPLLMRRGVCDSIGLWPPEEETPALTEEEREEALRLFYEDAKPEEDEDGEPEENAEQEEREE